MKKIVSNILVVSTQLLVGGLFLVSLFSNLEENSVIVENKNLNKMADSVSNLFLKENKVIEQELSSKDEESSFNIPIEEEVIITIEEQPEEIENNQEQDNSDESVLPSQDYEVLETYVGVLTGYGPDCVGCSGITLSGYDVSNTITYLDDEYGEVRIVAADSSFELYSIVRISNIPNSDPVIAIVLDRGGNVGFGRGTLFDLLFSSEAEALHMTKDVTFEILRRGK